MDSPIVSREIRFLLTRIAAHEHRLIGVEIARTDLHSYRNSAQLPFIILRAGLDSFASIDVYSQTRGRAPLPGAERLLDPVGGLEHACLVLVRTIDRYDHNFDRSEQRRRDESAVVAMSHHETANHPRRDSPAGVPREVQLACFGLERKVESTREILAEVVRGASLQRLVVLHHRLARIRPQRAGELLRLALSPVTTGIAIQPSMKSR